MTDKQPDTEGSSASSDNRQNQGVKTVEETDDNLRQQELQNKIIDNPFENLLKIDNLYRGALLASGGFFFVLLLFYFTLDESLHVHLIMMMLLDVGLVCAVVYFYPAVRELADQDNLNRANRLKQQQDEQAAEGKQEERVPLVEEKEPEDKKEK